MIKSNISLHAAISKSQNFQMIFHPLPATASESILGCDTIYIKVYDLHRPTLNRDRGCYKLPGVYEYAHICS